MSADQFLRDIGLNLKLEDLEMPEVKHNLLPFISLKSDRMDDPHKTIATHLRNLVATYGEAAVKEAIEGVLGGVDEIR